mmetsp:Transcript_27999/g.66172  ORF Transcript_27999/g.66172 Transcript_27999/m.66172 type:complete len:291 (-) Transcript_27999:48-920(-)
MNQFSSASLMVASIPPSSPHVAFASHQLFLSSLSYTSQQGRSEGSGAARSGRWMTCLGQGVSKLGVSNSHTNFCAYWGFLFLNKFPLSIPRVKVDPVGPRVAVPVRNLVRQAPGIVGILWLTPGILGGISSVWAVLGSESGILQTDPDLREDWAKISVAQQVEHSVILRLAGDDGQLSACRAAPRACIGRSHELVVALPAPGLAIPLEGFVAPELASPVREGLGRTVVRNEPAGVRRRGHVGDAARADLVRVVHAGLEPRRGARVVGGRKRPLHIRVVEVVRDIALRVDG